MQRLFFTELLLRVKSIELKGNPEITTFACGLKHLPIRYQLR